MKDKDEEIFKWHRQCEKNVIEAATKSEGKRMFFCLMLDGGKNILNTNYSECQLTIDFEFISSMYTLGSIGKWFEIPSENAED